MSGWRWWIDGLKEQNGERSMAIELNYIGRVDRGDVGTRRFKLGELLAVHHCNAEQELELSVQLVTENTNGALAARVRLRPWFMLPNLSEHFVGGAAHVACDEALRVQAECAARYQGERDEAVRKLAELRRAIETSIANAEDVTYYGESRRGHNIKAVSAKELRGVLDGRIT